mmetsp:Transcript_27964/g.32042  ORF Transcript_27964/g.32042 Transcript_27964/m.32042 type:complete len:564 (-) Transcript_27964:192-1883(-)
MMDYNSNRVRVRVLLLHLLVITKIINHLQLTNAFSTHSIPSKNLRFKQNTLENDSNVHVFFINHKLQAKRFSDGRNIQCNATPESITNNSSSSSPSTPSSFDDKQLDFTMGYLNKHHRDALRAFAEVFTPLGIIQAKKNAFSGGTYEIVDASVTGIEYNHNVALELSKATEETDVDANGNVGFLTLEVKVKIWNEKEAKIETVQVPLDAEPNKASSYKYHNIPLVPKGIKTSSNHIDDFVRRMNRLCYIINKSEVSGKLIQLAYQIGGDQDLLLKDNLYLNQVPHNRFIRSYFYDMASDAVLDAVIACSNKKISNRMKMTVLFPEMNPSMDSYRIGTLLEIARAISIRLAEQNLRVRLCVQGSMGVGIFTGTPKQLSGASTLLQRMDWQSNEGEQNEGMVGNFVNFGAVGKEHVMNARVDRKGNKIEQDDVFLILCPQSMIGVDSSIIASLSEMVDAAGDRPVILLNPDLSDKVSSQGQQNVRGRQQRMDFANSFDTIYHFQNIYISGTSYFPILGAITKTRYDMPWIAYQRRDKLEEDSEVYVPVLSSEQQPDGEIILSAFE